MSHNLEDSGERLIPEGNTKTLTYGEHMARYLALKNAVKGKTVLDIATGTGYGAQIISENAKKVFGVDNSKNAIEYAKDNFSALNIEYMVGKAENIPLQDNSIDIVVSFETIEHLEDAKKFLKEVKRVLAPGGIFITSTPNDEEFMDGNEFHLHEFNYRELQDLLKARFKNYRVYNQGTYFATALLPEESFQSIFYEKFTVHKTFQQKIEKSIFFLAIASDKKIDPSLIEANVVLADEWSTKEDLERDSERQKYKIQLEERAQDQLEQLNSMTEKYRLAEAELSAVKSSRAWKIVERLKSIRDTIVSK